MKSVNDSLQESVTLILKIFIPINLKEYRDIGFETFIRIEESKTTSDPLVLYLIIVILRFLGEWDNRIIISHEKVAIKIFVHLKDNNLDEGENIISHTQDITPLGIAISIYTLLICYS